jgi:hypothetical protein
VGTINPMANPEPHYAEAFFVQRGRCFRLISQPNAHGQPDHCPAPVAYHGIFTDRSGRRHQVDSCAGHAHDLEEPGRPAE